MANFQFGFDHRLYIACADSDPGAPVVLTLPQALTGEPTGATVHYNNANWQLYDNVRTVNVGGNATSVDITTRAEARSGFSSEVDVTTAGEMTFEVRYKPLNDDGTYADPTFAALMRAWLGRKEIAAVDLDKPMNIQGAQGLCGNWTVSFSNQKEVQGVVLANLTLKLSSWAAWIVAQDTSGTNFAKFS